MATTNSTLSNSTVTNTTSTYPAWLPSGFKVSSDKACPSTERVLTSFALYNGIAIILFVVTGNSRIRALFQRKTKLKAWSFWSSLSSLLFQVAGIVVTPLLIRMASGASGQQQASIGQLVQLWALRPRVNWFIGNMINVKRKWGYSNGALSHTFVEVFVCSFACVFLVRIIIAAFMNPPPANEPRAYWHMIFIAAIIMLISTAGEILWALWMVKRLIETKGTPEAQDMDSLKWIAGTAVPVTAICSWLIWVAFLSSTRGVYCPGNLKYVDLVWCLVPLFSNATRLLIESVQ
jgi:hypothetical protein